MVKIDLSHEPNPGTEFSCDNCNDYRNKAGEWRSEEPHEPGRVVQEADTE